MSPRKATFQNVLVLSLGLVFASPFPRELKVLELMMDEVSLPDAE